MNGDQHFVDSHFIRFAEQQLQELFAIAFAAVLRRNAVTDMSARLPKGVGQEMPQLAKADRSDSCCFFISQS